LLVVIGLVALLVAFRLPALCRTKTPAHLVQCMSNCRQIAQASLLYRADYRDCFPYGQRTTSNHYLTNETSWPMLLLRYLGGYNNTQPQVYLCPNEKEFFWGWPFQLHYQANRGVISDVDNSDAPFQGSQVRYPARTWIFMEKGPYDFANIRPGGLAMMLFSWNTAPGAPTAYRRHGGGMTAAAVDGHVEWLRTPLYLPGRPPPQNFMELGDCINGQNPASSWIDNTPPTRRIKLYCRYSQSGL